MNIVGLDLSLTCTGVAHWDGYTYATGLIKPKATMRGHERLGWILNELREWTDYARYVVVEGPSYGGSGQQGIHERGGLWWMITHELWLRDTPTAVAPPASVKKYATGTGNASKDLVLTSVVRRFTTFDGNNDEADALVLAALGADHLGQPIVPMPQTHRDALTGVAWPDGATA